ncbi:MAG: FIST N-terminal domain-containing protein [Pikeienuella sp.]
MPKPTSQADKKHALLRAQACCRQENPIQTIKDQLSDQPLAFIALFVSPTAEFATVVAEAEFHFPDIDVVACTTAGEIGTRGYEDDLIVAVGFPSGHFISKSILIENLTDHDFQPTVDRVAIDRVALKEANGDKREGFAFLLVDGLSLNEDTLTAALAPALRDMPLFGGSAGDGTTFGETMVALNGKVCKDAAILTLIRTDHQTHVFSIDHLTPTENQMVVTEADPARRVVRSINAEPAAQEYARLVGKNPDELDQFTFASHPVVVRIGGTHHVRAIQQVNEEGELVFFAAIDEGMVLTVAKPQEIAAHLKEQLDEFSEAGDLTDILGCDCILRRIEAEQVQITHRLSEILADHKVVGFSTYGEQIGPLHVNHTMTGVAIYARNDAEEV